MIRAFRGLDALRWMQYLLLFFLISAATLLTIPQVFVIVLAHHKSFFEKHLGKFLGKSLIVQKINVNWSLFYPGLTLQKVTIKDLKDPLYKVSVSNLKVSINPFESIFFRKLVLSSLFVQGVHMVVDQGQPNPSTTKSHLHSGKNKIMSYELILNSFLSKLMIHGNVIFRKFNINYRWMNGENFLIENLSLFEKNESLTHQFLSGHALVKAPFKAMLSFNVAFKGTSFVDPRSQAKFYFHLRNIRFNNLISHLSLNNNAKENEKNPSYSDLELWGIRKKAKIQVLQGHWAIRNMELTRRRDEKSWNKQSILPSERKITLNSMNSYFSWKLLDSGRGWFLQANPIYLTVNRRKWPVNYFWFQRDYKKAKDYFYINSLLLTDWSCVIPRLFKFRSPPRMKNFAIKGFLKNIYISYSFKNHQDGKGKFSFEHLRLLDKKTSLDVDGLFGRVSVNGEQGVLFLRAKDGHAAISNLYHSPFPIHSLRAKIEWRKAPSGYQIDVPNYQFDINGLLSVGQLFLCADQDSKMNIQWTSNYQWLDLTGLRDLISSQYLLKKILLLTGKNGSEGMDFLRRKITDGTSRIPLILRTKFLLDFTKTPIDFLGNGSVSLGKEKINFHLKSEQDKLNLTVKGRLPVREEKMIEVNKGNKRTLYAFSGEANYQANLNFYKNNKSLLMDADMMSDLKGIRVSGLFNFINKSRAERSPIHLHIELYRDRPNMIFFQNTNRLYSKLFFSNKLKNNNSRFLYSEIYLGPNHPKEIKTDLPDGRGIFIHGHLKEMSWFLTEFFIKKIFIFKNGFLKVREVFGLPLRVINIDIDRLIILKREVHHLSFEFHQVPFHSVFSFNSPEMKGNIFIPNYSGGTWTASFDYLNLPFFSKDDFFKINWSLLKVTSFIPPIDFVIKQLSYGGIQYGKMMAKVLTYGHDEIVGRSFLAGPLVTLSVNGKLEKKPHQETEIFGSIATKNLGKLLMSLGVARHLITQGQGRGNFYLFWPDFPEKVGLQKAKGYFLFDVHQGRLMVTDKKIMKLLSLARLINVFKVETLPRRLTLNFSDLAKQGLQFYSIAGRMTMNQGVFFLPRTILNGPIVNIKIKGFLNYLTKKYDFFVHIRPYFTSSLPLMIGLISGPIVGAIAWVINEITAPQIGKAVGFVYHLRGDLDSSSKKTLSFGKWNRHS